MVHLLVLFVLAGEAANHDVVKRLDRVRSFAASFNGTITAKVRSSNTAAKCELAVAACYERNGGLEAASGGVRW